MTPKPLKPGDGLSLGWLNGVLGVSGSGRLRVDPRTGLQLIVTPFGSFLRAVYPPDGWYKVTGAASGVAGGYQLREQVELASGAWADGVRVVAVAYESNLNTAVPTGSTVRVWARKRRGVWRFTYGAC